MNKSKIENFTILILLTMCGVVVYHESVASQIADGGYPVEFLKFVVLIMTLALSLLMIRYSKWNDKKFTNFIQAITVPFTAIILAGLFVLWVIGDQYVKKMVIDNWFLGFLFPVCFIVSYGEISKLEKSK